MVFDAKNTVNTTSTDIYIPLIYPSQSYSSLVSYPLPVITGTHFDLSYIVINGTTATSIIDSSGDFNTYYVNGQKINNKSINTPLTGIILSNTQTTNLTTSSIITFPDNTTHQSVVLNIGNLSTTNTTNNTITGYYRNYGGNGLSATYNFGTFLSSGPPSTDGSITFITITSSSASFNINRPTYADNSNPGNTTTLLSYYDISYSTPGSTISYTSQSQGPLQLSRTNYTGPTTTGPTITTLFPDCSYSFTLISTNTAGLSSASLLTNPILSTTFINANISTTINQLLLNGGTSNTVFLYTNSSTALTSPLFNNTNILTTTLTSLPINKNPLTRGLLGSGSGKKLMDISANVIDTVTTTIVAFVDTSFNSFPLNASNTNKRGSNLTISYASTSDQYTGTPGSLGFYAKANNLYLDISKNAFPSPTTTMNLYKINIVQCYYTVNNTVDISYNQIFNFYYDDISGLPTVSIQTFNFSTNTTIQYISGVATIGAPKYSITSTINNMSKFVYIKPIITYVFSGGSTTANYETNLAPNGVNNGNNSLSFSNADVSSTINSSFQKSVTLQIQPKNINGTNTATATLSLNAIFDQPSITLLNSISSSISTISSLNTFVNGCRIYSSPPQNLNNSVNSATSVSDYTYTPLYADASTNLISYSNYLYDASMHKFCKLNSTANAITLNGTTPVVIDSTAELQLFNGLYQSITDSASRGYLDYSGNYGNDSTLKYNLIVPGPYRFATFCWATSTALGSLTFSTFNFILSNFARNGQTLPSLTLTRDLNGCYKFNGDNRILIHYRVEDSTGNSNAYIVPSNSVTNGSTVWVDGNSSFSSNSSGFVLNDAAINSANYNINPNLVKFTPNNNYTTVVSTSNLQIRLDSIVYTPTRPGFIYLRIGLPTSECYSFSGVSLSLVQ